MYTDFCIYFGNYCKWQNVKMKVIVDVFLMYGCSVLDEVHRSKHYLFSYLVCLLLRIYSILTNKMTK